MFKNKKISIALLMVLSAAVQLTPVNLYALGGGGGGNPSEPASPKADDSAQADSWFSWRNLAAGTAVTSVVAGLTTWAYKSYAGDDSGDEVEDITKGPAADDTAGPDALVEQGGWTRNQKLGAGAAALAVTGVVAGAGYKYRTDAGFKKSVDDKTGAAWTAVEANKGKAAAGVAATVVAGGLAYYLTRTSDDASDSDDKPIAQPEPSLSAVDSWAGEPRPRKSKSIKVQVDQQAAADAILFNGFLNAFVATLSSRQKAALSATTKMVRKDRNPMYYFTTKWKLWEDKPGSETMREVQHQALNDLVQFFGKTFFKKTPLTRARHKLYAFIIALDHAGNYFRKSLFNAVSQYIEHDSIDGFDTKALCLLHDETERSAKLAAFIRQANDPAE